VTQTLNTNLVDQQRLRAQSRVGVVLKDKWRLDSLLGVGGMAAVYAATHRNQKRVAVKMLHAEFSQQGDTRTRFLREGYAANVIEHPGAVSVLDDDVSEDGNAFLVMELLEGETLDQRWERNAGRLPFAEVLAFADQLLDVLALAHIKGIVHRDIKPENVFLTREGVIKVLDFGIARVFETAQDAKQATRAGQVIGTPAFMAPEQALARWNEIDGRTDVWAVGATMFTLISGMHVHEAQTGTEQLVYSATRPARSIASVVSGVPPSVVAIIDRALAFEKVQRWPDARNMQGAVRAALSSFAPQPPVDPRLAGMGGAAPRVPSAPSRTPQASVPEFAPSESLAGLDPVQLQAQVSARAVERDQRAKEIAQAQPIILDLTTRHNGAKQRVADALARLTAARNERAALEEWFKNHVGGQASAADAAREHLNQAFAQFARAVLGDTQTFGAEFDGAREEIVRLGKQSEAAQHDLAVHQASLEAYDKKAVTQGIVVTLVAALVLAILFFMPVIIRYTAD
jgi:serine/threonine protein kinase